MILREYLALPQGCTYEHLAIDDVFDTPKASGNLYADFGIGREDLLSALHSSAPAIDLHDPLHKTKTAVPCGGTAEE